MNEPDESAEPSVSERVEEVARAAATLAASGAELAAVEHRDEARRAVRAGAGAVVVGIALAAVFVFGNWAAERALEPSLNGWRAPLVLAGAWLVVAAIAAVVVARLEPRLRSLGRGEPEDPAAALAARQAAFDEAQHGLQEALEGLTTAIAAAAGREVASAMLPVEGIADFGEDVADASEQAMEIVDEVTDVIEERVPGGVIVNRAFDIVLIPGRYGVRAARVVLSFGQPPGSKDPPEG
jgi:Putative Actinobacterial Holin-X, holin superfamily III